MLMQTLLTAAFSALALGVAFIPKLIAEINTIIADHSRNDSKEEKEAIDLLKRARDALSLARAKLHEADVKKNRME